MKIIVACGGTGGHAFPGIVVAQELQRRGHDITIWCSGRDVESGVLQKWSGAVFSTGAKQLAIKNAFAILCSIFRCRREIRRVKPDALLAMGSYSSLPPVLAARSFSVPVILHEANTVPGRAVEFLSKCAKVVAISFKTTKNFLRGVATEQTGLPVRSEIANGKAFPFIPPNSFVVFVTGGSQGAHVVNMLASEALVHFNNELKKRNEKRQLYVIHQTGARDEGYIIATYARAGIPSRVHKFETDMASAFASADFVISRAGASTCFELALCGKAALLIPLPSALRNHQHFNADAFAAVGAADEGIQENLLPYQLSRYLMNKYENPEQLEKMRTKILALSVSDAATRVADLVLKTIDK